MNKAETDLPTGCGTRSNTLQEGSGVDVDESTAISDSSKFPSCASFCAVKFEAVQSSRPVLTP